MTSKTLTLSCPIKSNRPRHRNLSPEQIRICKAAKLHNYRHNTLKIGPVPAQAARAWHPSVALPRVAVLIGAVAPCQVTDEVTEGLPQPRITRTLKCPAARCLSKDCGPPWRTRQGSGSWYSTVQRQLELTVTAGLRTAGQKARRGLRVTITITARGVEGFTLPQEYAHYVSVRDDPFHRSHHTATIVSFRLAVFLQRLSLNNKSVVLKGCGLPHTSSICVGLWLSSRHDTLSSRLASFMPGRL